MNKIKRACAGLLAALFVAVGLTVLLPPQSAAAANVDDLCVPRTLELTGHEDHHAPAGWLRLTFVNRAHIEVELVPSGNCSRPSNTSMEFIFGNVPFAPLVSGPYNDTDTGDGNFDYRFRNGNSNSDDSVIDNFDNQDVDDAFGGNDRVLSTAQIRDFIEDNSPTGAELVFGIEESALQEVECVDGDNNDGGKNFIFHNEDDDSEGPIWECLGELADGLTGLSVRGSFGDSLEGFNITYNYEPAANRIVHVSEGERGTRTFTFCQNENTYRSENCGGDLTIEATQEQLEALGEGTGTFEMRKDGSNDTEEVIIAGADSDSAAATEEADGGQAGAGEDLQDAIECELSINPLTWIICPVVAAANETVEQLDNYIVSELNVNEDSYFDENDPDTGERFYKVWANFRNLGLIILVLAALVMVISQALAVGPFDAYTVKKVLPRILVAIIFMTLSWDISKFLINLTNDVGLGVRTIIQAPFASIDNPVVGGLQTTVATTILGGVGILALGLVGVLTFAVTALMAVLVAFLVLTLRKMIIVFLVLVAPFAIACYILPNTQKVYKLWWDTFSKALLMFPIIMGFIAVGRVFAKVSSADRGLLDQIILMVAYFGPYFALPTAFRLAGGAIATISGLANDRSRGAFDRLKGFRKNRSADRVKKFRGGGLYDKNTLRGRIGNQFGGWAFNADEKLPHGLGGLGVPGFKGAHTRLDAHVRHAQEEQTREFAQKINERGGNDQTGRVLAGAVRIGSEEEGGFSASTHKELWDRFGKVDKKTGERVWGGLKTEKDFDDAAAILGKSDRAAEVHASRALQGLKGDVLSLNREGKGYTNVAAAGGLIVASHGFATEQDVVDIGRTVEGQTNAAFADTMMTQMEVNGKNSGLKVTYSHSRDRDGNIITGTEAGRNHDRALSKSYQDIATQKKHAVKSDVDDLSEIIWLDSLSTTERRQVGDQWLKDGMSAEQVASRMTNVEGKAAAAKDTLAKIIAYNPGATDTVTVVEEAYKNLESLGINARPSQPTAAPDPRTLGGGTPPTPGGGGFGAPPVPPGGGGFGAPGI